MSEDDAYSDDDFEQSNDASGLALDASTSDKGAGAAAGVKDDLAMSPADDTDVVEEVENAEPPAPRAPPMGSAYVTQSSAASLDVSEPASDMASERATIERLRATNQRLRDQLKEFSEVRRRGNRGD